MKSAILRVFAALFANGTVLDRFSVKFTPRNNHENLGTYLGSIEYSGLPYYWYFLSKANR